MKKFKAFMHQNGLYVAWVIALVAVVGSLYFSEVRGFAPCVLCWYQRIAIYPLIILLPIGILKKDPRIADYVLSLTVVGLLISIFQNLLYYKVIPESISPCTAGVSCTTKYVEYFGFISIPLLSFIALASITYVMVVYKKSNNA